MTSPAPASDMAVVDRAIDSVLMSFATADLHARPVQLNDIKEAVFGQYVTHVFDQIRTQLDRGPCSDGCVSVDAVSLTSAVYTQALLQHVAVEVSLLRMVQKLTGEAPGDVLRRIREEAERAEA